MASRAAIVMPLSLDILVAAVVVGVLVALRWELADLVLAHVAWPWPQRWPAEPAPADGRTREPEEGAGIDGVAGAERRPLPTGHPHR
jgi:hypothetical protein